MHRGEPREVWRREGRAMQKTVMCLEGPSLATNRSPGGISSLVLEQPPHWTEIRLVFELLMHIKLQTHKLKFILTLNLLVFCCQQKMNSDKMTHQQQMASDKQKTHV